MSMDARVRQALSRLFDETTAEACALDNLGGHASLRIYWRVHLPSGVRLDRGDVSLMAMVLPEGLAALGSDEGGSSQDAAPEELPFVDVQRLLGAQQLRVPSIDSYEVDLGVLLLEDLGDRTFEQAYLEASSEDDKLALYREAIALLVEVQSKLSSTAAEKHESVAWGKRFDAELLRWELDHFWEWGLEAQLGAREVAPWKARFESLAERLVGELLGAPQTLCLRDYQSRNIMLKAADDWVLIDFQDALRGPFIYDLVALLRDSYIALEPDQVDELVLHYGALARGAHLPWAELDEGELMRWFALQTLQRKLKDAGRFIYIDRVKGNPGFLDYFQPSISYIQHALGHAAGYAELRDLLEATVATYSPSPTSERA